MKAKEYRASARDTLSGKWRLAVGTTLVAALLGAVNTNQFGFSTSITVSDLEIADDTYSETLESILDIVSEVAVIFGFIGALLLFVSIILGPVTKAGLCRFNKNLYYNSNPKFNDIFTHYDKASKIIRMMWAGILIFVFTFLWFACPLVPGVLILVISIPQIFSPGVAATILVVFVTLFSIPGMAAMISYMMTFYILDENPDLPVREAIYASKVLMDGHKWQYVCLMFSFYGWLILATIIPFGLLFYNPYWLAAEYAFYNSIAKKDVDYENMSHIENAGYSVEDLLLEKKTEEVPQDIAVS